MLPRYAPLVLALVALAGCRDEAPADDAPTAADSVGAEVSPTPGNTVLTAARAAGLSTFETAVLQAGLDQTLQGEGPFTIFAPTDAAFDALGDARDSLFVDDRREQLRNVLLYHVVRGRLDAATLASMTGIGTEQGSALGVQPAGDGLVIVDAEGNQARVVTRDLNAGNGVIHTIDRVLRPGLPGDSAASADSVAAPAAPR